MIKKLIKFFSLNKKKAPIEPTPPPKSKNPYSIIWYKQGWSSRRVAKNNIKYWNWENENYFKK